MAETKDILIEYQFGRYCRQLTLAEVIDQSKIDTALDNGVLRLTLPKLEKAMPRQITVKAGLSFLELVFLLSRSASAAFTNAGLVGQPKPRHFF